MTPERVLRFEELNADQQLLAKAIEDDRNVLVTGAAGTGKSALIKYLASKYGDEMAITGTTGIAALGIGGCTIHRWAGLGLADKPAHVIAAGIRERKGDQYFQIKRCKKLVIDEISMLGPQQFQLLNDVLQIVRRNQDPFGGIQLIGCGDFLQLPSVVKDDQKTDQEARDMLFANAPIARFAFEAPAWAACQPAVKVLEKVMRQKDEHWAGILRRIRVGDTCEDVRKVLRPRIGAIDPDKTVEPIVGVTHNRDADRINQEKLEQLPGEDVYMDADDWGISEAMKGQIDKACIAPKTLRLRVGAQVMLLWNVDTDAGLVNGSLGKVVDFKKSFAGRNVPVCDFGGNVVELDRVEWSLKKGDKVEATRSQIPLRLGWAITGHKLQGVTVDKIRVHLKRCFEYGQAYVMLSRARTLEGLFIADIGNSSIKAHPTALEFYARNAQWIQN